MYGGLTSEFKPLESHTNRSSLGKARLYEEGIISIWIYLTIFWVAEYKMSKKKTLNGIQQSMKQHNAESSNSKTGFNERSNTAKEPGIANTKGL